jgi:EAL domain-containing protein (putative c-di-GMP-specific phosphodiesterase class I)
MYALSKTTIPDINRVVPFFQPIVSLQTQRIIAYESLGREIIDGRVRSLGLFFGNAAISDDVHITIDRHLRDLAFEKISNTTGRFQLFINLKPSWIYHTYHKTGELPTLHLIDKYDLSPSRIVIEIVEEEFYGNLQDLCEVLEVYRRKGCMLAIDDVGSGFSNLDRIAIIQPKILKIDLKIMKKSAKHEGYRALLRSFSIIAAQMGASLLVEGVETKEDLQNALLAGARYAQGFLFAPAAPEFLPEDHFTEMLCEEISLYHEQELKKHSRLFEIEQALNHLYSSEVLLIQNADEADAVLERFVTFALDIALRYYICKEDGSQISSNYNHDSDGNWVKDEGFRGSNWIWRPYFIPNILTMKHHKIGILSRPYSDLDTSSFIQTYSCPIGNGYYMFMDLAI